MPDSFQSRIDIHSEDFQANRMYMQQLVARMEQDELGYLDDTIQPDAAHQGRGSIWQCIDQLCDPQRPLLEIGALHGKDAYKTFGRIQRAGVITLCAFLHHRPCVVVATDPRMKGGAFFPAGVKKIIRAQQIALSCRLPVVYLLASGGAFLPLQDELFAPSDGFGRILHNMCAIHMRGLKQYAGVLGPCIGGGAIMAAMCDVVCVSGDPPVALPSSRGPSGDNTPLPQWNSPHPEQTRIRHHRAENQGACVRRLRECVAATTADPAHPGHFTRIDAMNHELMGILPADGHASYDNREIVTRIVDPNSWRQSLAHRTDGLLLGTCTMGRQAVAVISSQRMGHGFITENDAWAMRDFLHALDGTVRALLFIQDTLGLHCDTPAGQIRMVRCIADMIRSVARQHIPRLSLILRGGFGPAHYALCGRAMDPMLLFAWPSAQCGALEEDQAASVLTGLGRRRLQRHRAIADTDREARLRKVRTQDMRNTDALTASRRGDIDVLIHPANTRNILLHAILMLNP